MSFVSKISIIIPVCNEEEKLESIIKEVKKLDPFEIITVINGSSDRTKQIAENLDCKIIEYKYRLGHDVGRAIGAFYAKGDLLLFLDGDILIPYTALEPFIKAIEEGYDIALNNLECLLDIDEPQHCVTNVKQVINHLFQYPELTLNSLVAIPHAIHRRTLDRIGWFYLSVPPLFQALAMKQGYRITCPTFIDVVSTNKLRPDIHVTLHEHSPYSLLTEVIIGDHMMTLQILKEQYTDRITLPNKDQLQSWNLTGNTKINLSAVINDTAETSTPENLLNLIYSLISYGVEEVILLTKHSYNLDMFYFPGKQLVVIPVVMDVGNYTSNPAGAVLSSGEFVLFLDSHLSANTEELQSLCSLIQSNADVILLNENLPSRKVDKISALTYFFNIMLKRPELGNSSLLQKPYILKRHVIEELGWSVFTSPLLAQVRMIENNYNIVTYEMELPKGEYEMDLIVPNFIEAIFYYMTKTDSRAGFSKGTRRFDALLELDYNVQGVNVK